MAIAQVVAGAFIGTFNRGGEGALALNYTRQGFNLNFTMKGERVEESDIYGLCFLDLVYRGYQLSIDMVCRVYSSVTIGAMMTFSSNTLGNVYTPASPIGQLASGADADVLVLTAVANTPAAIADVPGTVTASVIISPDNNMQTVLNSTARDAPLKFEVLLEDNAGTGRLLVIS